MEQVVQDAFYVHAHVTCESEQFLVGLICIFLIAVQSDETLFASEMEPGERVICEIPVYLSKALSHQLYLVQYPQRPVTLPVEKEHVVDVKIKPNLNKLQLTVGVETDSKYYDEFHGELLAEAAEGLGLNEDEYVPDTRKKIETTVMESGCHPKVTSSAQYVAGIIKDGSVHLTPLKSIVQMKPTLPYLNKADKARAKHENASAGGDTEDETEDQAKKVTVKFQRQPFDPNRVPSTSKSSFSARKKEDEEAWLPLTFEEPTAEIFSKLVTQNVDNDEPMYVLTQKDYLAKLFPKHVETVIDGSDKVTSTSTASQNQQQQASRLNQKINVELMKDLEIGEQLKILILNGRVMRYDQIQEFLKTRLHSVVDETTLLKKIQNVAVLVQGCWVAKSDVLYPDTFKSNVNGVSGTVMQAARETVLSYFTEHRIVERVKLAPILHLPTDELTEILMGVAKRVERKGWEFLLDFDHTFMAKHPDIVQRQNRVWEMVKAKTGGRNRKISDSSNCNLGGGGSGKDGLKPPLAKSPPRRRHSRTTSCSSDSNDLGLTPDTGERGRRASGSGGGRQRRNSSRSSSESSAPLLGVPSKPEC